MRIYTFVMNRDADYREILPEDESVKRLINKFYILQGKSDIQTIPDGCLDLQLTETEGNVRLFLCGSFLQEQRSPVSACSRVFGVKLQPDVLPMEDSCSRIFSAGGNRMEITPEIFCRHLHPGDREKVALCLNTVGRNFREDPDGFSLEQEAQRISRVTAEIHRPEEKISVRRDIARRASMVILRGHGNISMQSLADSMGYSLKYLDRVFRQEYGIPMKRYAVIIRMQRAIRYLEKNVADGIYEDLGFYDQAYFIRQCRQYTGMTPGQLMSADAGKVVR